MSAVRFVFEDPRLTEQEIGARLRRVPARALVEGLVSGAREYEVDEVMRPALRIALRLAVRRGGEAEVAGLAADSGVTWWARAAAACALLDTEQLGPAHGAAVFEALVFGLLGVEDAVGAAEAATAAVATCEDRRAVIGRIEGWRALCGVPRDVFWATAAERLGFEPGDLSVAPGDEVRVRAWATAPDGLGEYMARFEVAPRGVRCGACTVVILRLNVEDGVRLDFPVFLASEAATVASRASFVALGGVEAPAAELAALVGEALAITTSPVSTRGARLVTRLVAGALPEAPCGPLPDAAATAALLARYELAATWFFDEVDRELAPPDAPDAALSPELQARTVECALLAARWFRWRGEPYVAASMVALARDASLDWRGSRLRAALLGASGPAALPPEAAPGAPDDLRLRRVPLEEAHGYAVRVVEACAASPEGKARGTDLSWARAAVEYGLTQAAATPLTWSPWLLRERILCEVFATQATATGADAPAICADLRALLAFLGARWGLPQARALADALDPRFEAGLAVHLDDQRLWLPPKRVMVQARADGVLGDRAEILRRLAADPLAGPFVAGMDIFEA